MMDTLLFFAAAKPQRRNKQTISLTPEVLGFGLCRLVTQWLLVMRSPCGLTFNQIGPEATGSGCRRNKTKTFLTSYAPWDDFRLSAEVRFLSRPSGREE